MPRLVHLKEGIIDGEEECSGVGEDGGHDEGGVEEKAVLGLVVDV
jgi:hypothetical protein